MAIDFFEKTTFLPSDSGEREFTSHERLQILKVMQDAYASSSVARNMFEYWVFPPASGGLGRKIKIKFKKDKFEGFTNGSGLVQIDPNFITNASYIDFTGTAVKDTLDTALIHELGHALNFTTDNTNTLDYAGANVTFVNKIYKELGFPQQISYTAYDRTGTINKLNYKYTNDAALDGDGKAIDAAVSLETISANNKINWDSSPLGTSRDLLIGGSSNNILQSGAGNDFLLGGGKNDTLDGGTGKDTGVYFGSKGDYDIRQKSDGSWTFKHARGAKNAGSDTLRNIELAQFDDPKNPGKKETIELKKGGLAFQTDIALVFDTTGSYAPYLASLSAEISKLADALFIGGKDTRIGIVGFKDTTIGQSSQVLLPFTEQDDFADRKSATIAAMDGLTYSVGFGYGDNLASIPLPPPPAKPNGFIVGGGGDVAETSFDGLRLALKESMGEWRASAGTRKIVLFTDAPPKDGALSGEVTYLAKSIGATMGSISSLALAGGSSIDTFSLSFSGSDSSLASRDTEGGVAELMYDIAIDRENCY